MGWRNVSVLLLAGVGCASALLYTLNFGIVPFLNRLGFTDPQKEPLAAYPYLFFSLFALYALALAFVLKRRSGPSSLGLILGFALLFRATLLSSPLVLSSDLYRYIWDGRVQAAGINPYLYPPSAQELAFLRDEQVFPFINRPHAPTIYPPGAQMLFAVIYTFLPDSVPGMKVVMMLFDLATMLLILRLLKKAGINAERILVYAWSPLVIFELAGSGHAEAFMLPFVLLALLARMDGKPFLTGAALGIATLIKLYPAVLFPAFYKRRDRLFPLAFGATILLGYLPYLYGAGWRVVGFLPDYLGPWEDFNVGLRDFLTSALVPFTGSPRLIAMLLLTALLVAVAISLGRQGRREDLLWRGYLIVGAYFLLLPTSLHPWYLTWLLPFLCLYPSWGWLYFSGAISLSYLKYVQDPQVLPLWIRLVEFFPLYLLLFVEFLRHRHPKARSKKAMATMMEKPR
jgi:hypothetical protein